MCKGFTWQVRSLSFRKHFYKPSNMFLPEYQKGSKQENMQSCCRAAAYPHTGTCRRGWWAAVCPPCHGARRSGRYRAPYSRSSPSLTARGDDSHSTEGWLLSPWWRDTTTGSPRWQRTRFTWRDGGKKVGRTGGERLVNYGGRGRKERKEIKK